MDSKAELAVDGGINQNTAAKVADAGARVLVAGSAIYNAKEGIQAAIAQIRENAELGRK
jgi:ribulose-phosphate 3-epimerase